MDSTVIYIHGASSTPLSFNYIVQNLPDHKKLFVNYDSEVPLSKTITDLYEALPSDKPLFLVGHSLGGVIGTALTYVCANRNDKVGIKKLVALSSPFAGSRMANYLKWMYPHYGLFDNVATSNPVIQKIQEFGAIIPSLVIVTHGGKTPLIKGKNDGVVSVTSQMSLRKAQYKSFELNHFEVLLSNEIIKEIKSFLWEE